MLKFVMNIAIVVAATTLLIGGTSHSIVLNASCLDMPHCYQLHDIFGYQPPLHLPNTQFATAVQLESNSPMLHHQLAEILGFCVAIIFLICQWQKRNRLLVTLIFSLVCLQSALGWWTLTPNSMPVAAALHVAGGLSLLSLLVLLRVQVKVPFKITQEPQLAPLIPIAWLSVALLFMQFSLNAWNAAHFAGLACGSLSVCEPSWMRQFSLSSAFNLPPPANSLDRLTAMSLWPASHTLQNLGSLATLVVVSGLALAVLARARTGIMRGLALSLPGLFILQISLGRLTLITQKPLTDVLAHNVVAGCLSVVMTLFIYQLYQRCYQSRVLVE